MTTHAAGDRRCLGAGGVPCPPGRPPQSDPRRAGPGRRPLAEAQVMAPAHGAGANSGGRFRTASVGVGAFGGSASCASGVLSSKGKVTVGAQQFVSGLASAAATRQRNDGEASLSAVWTV